MVTTTRMNLNEHRWENLIANANIWWMLKVFLFTLHRCFKLATNRLKKKEVKVHTIFSYIFHVEQINFCLIWN